MPGKAPANAPQYHPRPILAIPSHPWAAPSLYQGRHDPRAFQDTPLELSLKPDQGASPQGVKEELRDMTSLWIGRIKIPQLARPPRSR